MGEVRSGECDIVFCPFFFRWTNNTEWTSITDCPGSVSLLHAVFVPRGFLGG